MKYVILAILFAVLSPTTSAFSPEIISSFIHLKSGDNGDNGGSSCAGCTLLVAILEQTMQVKSQNASEAVATFCGYLPEPLAAVCDIAIPALGETIFPLMDAKESPDTVCNVLTMCKAETRVCRLFPTSKATGSILSDDEFMIRNERLKVEHPVPKLQSFNICTIIPGVCKYQNHLPFDDADDDLFSIKSILRGSDWRGKDCDDSSATVYPGRSGNDTTFDGNCNGIWGVNNVSGRSYESELCGNSTAMGVATLGDSASAHFRLPQDIFEAANMNAATFANILDFISDEADWPMLSWATGHQPTDKYAPSVTGPMQSVYSMINDLNKCNHRDYQNIGVNGANSQNLPAWLDMLARNQVADKPILAFFAMIGNDVCGSEQDFTHMTTPQEYYDAFLSTVLAADQKLPAGSHVVLVPLVDGRVLFREMHNRIHPIGALNNDVTYTGLYDYLNCLVASPCWGWMNSNGTIRDTTWQVASSLNAQLPKVVSDTQGKLQNIQLHFIGSLFDEVINNYSGPKWELIEPVDGFHPSQIANAILGNYTFTALQTAGVIPLTANPNNALIEQLFGVQGGY